MNTQNPIALAISNRWHRAASVRSLTPLWPTLLLTRKKIVTMNFKARGEAMRMTFRRSTSDPSILEEVLSNDVYACSKHRTEPCIVMDFGAHIGSFTTNFLVARPAARAICIEPNPFSYSLLVQNLQANRILSRSTCVSAALVSRETLALDRFVRLDFPDGKDDIFEQFQVSPHGRWVTLGTSLEALSVLLEPSLPIVIKMDIEGGELPLVGEFFEFLNTRPVSMLFMEFHGTPDQQEDWVRQLRSIGFVCDVDGIIIRADRSAV